DADFGCPTPGACTGKVVTDFGADDEGGAVAIQADGKIVVAGRSGATGSFDFAVARYNVNGTLDPDFGCPMPGSCTGKVLTDLGGTERATAAPVPPDRSD